MPREPIGTRELKEIAERLRITRRALGYTQGFISTLIGSTTESGQAWENYESARRRISLNHAMALCRKCGLTLDWIYFGNLASLHGDIASKITAEINRAQRAGKESAEPPRRLRHPRAE